LSWIILWRLGVTAVIDVATWLGLKRAVFWRPVLDDLDYRHRRRFELLMALEGLFRRRPGVDMLPAVVVFIVRLPDAALLHGGHVISPRFVVETEDPEPAHVPLGQVS